MREHKVGAILVTDAHRNLLGIFTGRDAVGRVIADGKSAEKTTLAEVMTAKPRTMTPSKTAIDALHLMHDTGCRHVPILEYGKVVGIASTADFRGRELDRLDEETGFWERI